MNTELVNPEVLKALTDPEVLEKAEQYEALGKIENKAIFFNIADVYWHEHIKRCNSEESVNRTS